MKKKFELDRILKLVEERELLTSQLNSYDLPQVIIPTEEGNPLYKITISVLGDLLIFINKREIYSTYGMLSSIDMEDPIIDDMELPVAMTYLEAARVLSENKEKKKIYPRPTRRVFSIRENPVSEEESSRTTNADERWSLVFALSAVKCLDLVELLYKIFGDDLRSQEGENKF